MANYEPIIVRCSYCKELFEKKDVNEFYRRIALGYTDFYCNLSCNAKARNQKYRNKEADVNCKYCGNTFTTTIRQDGSQDKTFCSRSCASAGSVTDARRQRMSEGGKIGGSMTGNADNISKLLKSREAWKYVQCRTLLESFGLNFEFEYPIDDAVFDLALPDNMILIEFDGDNHQYEELIRDAEKDVIASSNGWTLHRISVESNTAIKPAVLYPIVASIVIG